MSYNNHVYYFGHSPSSCVLSNTTLWKLELLPSLGTKIHTWVGPLEFSVTQSKTYHGMKIPKIPHQILRGCENLIVQCQGQPYQYKRQPSRNITPAP